MTTISDLWTKLRDPEYRKAFVASQVNIGIPFQIRALLKARGWKQEDLAKRANMLQPRISGMMRPGRTRPNIETLRRLAEAFDCGLMVRFVAYSELARWSEGFDPESFSVPCFEDDAGFIERKPPTACFTDDRVCDRVYRSGTDGIVKDYSLASSQVRSAPVAKTSSVIPISSKRTQEHTYA